MTATAPACEHCGGPLAGLRRHARFCSSRCRAAASRVRREDGRNHAGGRESAPKRTPRAVDTFPWASLTTHRRNRPSTRNAKGTR
jgi:hypothetical protein